MPSYSHSAPINYLSPETYIPTDRVPFTLRRLLGISRFVLSPQEYKRVLLTGQLNLLFFLSILAFTVMDVIWGYRFPIPFNLGAMACSVVVYLLHRQGKFFAARVLLAITANGITLLFASILDRNMGLYQFAICINVGLLAVFGYERARFAIGFIGLSSLLFIAALFHPFERIQRAGLADPAFLDRNLLFGFLIASAASATVVYYLLRINHHSEAELLEKERSISIKNEELREVNAELDRFFYSVSHDLRSPLTSMQGLLGLLETAQDQKEVSEYAALLRGRVENLDQFVRTVSSYASNARQEVQWQPVCLRQLFRDVLENVRFLPNAQAINITLDIPAHHELLADPTRLQIIFSNLIGNAIKYHDTAKPDPFIRIEMEQDTRSVTVRIEDNGSGIREDVLPRVFDMFYRGHDQSQGSGLGLYIVKEAIDKIGGHIAVESTYGQGSVFTVTLPVEPPSPV